ncbi:MAG: apolipoprotein N-acyltransferase [bacterium]
MRLRKKWLGVLLAFLTPVLFTLSFPPYDLSFLAWVALIPLLLALKELKRYEAFLFSWLIGGLSFRGVFGWIGQIEGFGLGHYIMLGIYLGGYFALFGLFVRLFDDNDPVYPLFVGLVWVLLEYIRSHFFFLALPWALLGHTQYRHIDLIQISSYAGVYGLSFLVILVNASLAEFLRRIPSSLRHKETLQRYAPVALYLVPLLLLPLISFWGKGIRKGTGHTAEVRVGLVQANIPQNVKWQKEVFAWSFERYEDLTRQVAQERPSVILWPETAIPIDFRAYPAGLWKISALVREIDIPLVFGAAGGTKMRAADADQHPSYNSAFFISPQGMFGEYKKMRLIPFGEYIPSIGHFSLSFLAPGVKAGFVPGRYAKLFPLQEGSFGVTICWENIFPDLFRKFVGQGASFMVNISNDGWFKNEAAPSQHLMCQVFRAVENRTSIARVANTGISCFIDPFGHILRRVEEGNRFLNVMGVASGEIPTGLGPTFYTRHGDLFMLFCMILFGLLIVWRVCYPHRTSITGNGK